MEVGWGSHKAKTDGLGWITSNDCEMYDGSRQSWFATQFMRNAHNFLPLILLQDFLKCHQIFSQSFQKNWPQIKQLSHKAYL